MWCRLCLLLFTCCLPSWLGAQTIDTAWINQLTQRAYSIHEDSAEAAWQLAQKVLLLSENAAFTKGKGDACIILGAIARNRKAMTTSDSFFRISLRLRRQLGDSLRVDAAISNLAINKLLQTQYDSAIVFCLHSINILEGLPARDEAALGGSYMLLSNIYDEYFEPDEAMRYARKSLQAYIRADEPDLIAEAAYTMGNRFYLAKSLDSAEHYYNLAYNNLMGSSSPQFDFLANILTNKANIAKDLRQFDKAKRLLEEAGGYFDKLGSEADRYFWYLAGADVDAVQNHWRPALQQLLQARAYTGVYDDWLNQKVLFEKLSRAYQSLGKTDSAFYYQSMAYTAADSLNVEKRQQIVGRFQSERLKKERLLADEEAFRSKERARTFALTASLLAALLAALAYLFWQKRRSYRLISAQRETLHRQAIDELLQSSELRYLSAGVEGREAEKEAIGREIHDRLGSAMISLSWQYEAIVERFAPGTPEHIQMQKLNDSLKSLYHDIRHIAHQLGAGVLERVGLVPVLDELCNDIRSANRMEVDFSAYGMEERLGFNKEVNVLRIVQELIGNTLKYAKATQLSVALSRMDENLNIIVEDNGVGFDPAGNKGMGLNNVEQRVRLLNGSLQIEKRPEGGVTILIDIPLERPEAERLMED